ncbi:MAG TPA: MFS transporter [Rhodothermales bacterium]
MPPPRTNRRTVFAWSTYDFANSAFTTLVVTFIYSTYFSSESFSGDPTRGTVLWSRGITLTALVVAVLSPYLGAIADRGGLRKRFLFTSTLICILATVALYFPQPGQLVTALVIFVVANVAFELGNVFYNAFLPDIAPREQMGRVSGYGWSLGYAGGLICMAMALFLFVQPATPPFGLSRELGQNVRATNLLVAVWFAVFSLPLFLWVREQRHEAVEGIGSIIRSANAQFRSTFHEIRRYRQIFRLLIARLIYNDGLVTIFAFGGIYANTEFGFSFEEVLLFGIVINVCAGVGAFLFGFVDDLIGGKRTLLVTLVGLTVAAVIAVTAQSRAMFWVAGVLIGLLVGPNQSASRSLMGRFVPDTRENEFYGFFAFSGKFASFLGPLTLGLVLDATGSHRLSVASIIVFFVVGGLLLLRLNEAEGIAASVAAESPTS